MVKNTRPLVMIDFHDSTNVIYGIHCVQCGLVYVGETGRSLRSRMNGHRSAIKKGGQSLLHRHFHQLPSSNSGTASREHNIIEGDLH